MPTEFFKKNVMPYVGPNPTDYNTQVSLFLSGQAPCMVNRPWSIGAVKKAGIDFFVAPLPPINDTYVPKAYGGLKMFYVTIYASKEAVDFMKWFTTDPQVAKIPIQKLGYVPVIKDIQIQDLVVEPHNHRFLKNGPAGVRDCVGGVCRRQIQQIRPGQVHLRPRGEAAYRLRDRGR